MRLDKFICKSTEYSLLEAISYIKNEMVTINGIIANSTFQQVHKNNVVTLNGDKLKPRDFRYYMFHKPTDVICSNVDEKHPSLFNLLDIERKPELHIAGRLDADTTGLVLITDDGHWSFNLTLPENKCEKIYKVVLSRPIKSDAVKRFAEGIVLQGESKLTHPAKLHVIDSYNVKLTLTEGRYHQVKRMFAAIGNRVKSLHRLQIGELELDVNSGQWRRLTKTEVGALSIPK